MVAFEAGEVVAVARVPAVLVPFHCHLHLKGKRGSGDPPQSGETEAPRNKVCPKIVPCSPFLQSDGTIFT